MSRKFYITYILIDRYRSLEDFSWITIKKILNYYGLKNTRNKPKAFKEILDVLEYMVNSKMISIAQDIDSITYDTGIEVKIISDNFDFPKNFCKFDFCVFDKIMDSDSAINNETLLLSYIYILSYIGEKSDQREGESDTEYLERLKEYPRAFFRDIGNMAKELSMSKDTITKCINYFLSEQMLVKKTVGSVKKDGKPPQNVPNIYVLNNDECQQEIEWALEKMKEIYKVDYFDEIKGGNKNQ